MWCWVFTWDGENSHGMLSIFRDVGVFIWDESFIWDVLFLGVFHMWLWGFTWDVEYFYGMLEYSYGISYSYGMFIHVGCVIRMLCWMFTLYVENSHGMLSIFRDVGVFIWEESFIWDVLFLAVFHMWFWGFTWDVKYSYGMLSIHMGCWIIHMGGVIHMGCLILIAIYGKLGIHMGND